RLFFLNFFFSIFFVGFWQIEFNLPFFREEEFTPCNPCDIVLIIQLLYLLLKIFFLCHPFIHDFLSLNKFLLQQLVLSLLVESHDKQAAHHQQHQTAEQHCTFFGNPVFTLAHLLFGIPLFRVTVDHSDHFVSQCITSLNCAFSIYKIHHK